MEDSFKNIDEEKRNRIINSAMQEFGNNTYEKASTNNIVKNANISKGALFHYFKNKKALYDYLEKLSYEVFFETIKKKVDWNETDIFKRLKQIVIVKIEITKQYPHIFKFSLKTFFVV